MEWTEIIIEVNVKDLDKAGNIAHMISSYGIYIEDYSCLRKDLEEVGSIDLIDEELLSKDPSRAMIHVYLNSNESPNEAISFIEERFNHENIKYKINTLVCSENDWINNWKKYFKPTPIGNKIIICPSWEEVPDSNKRTILKIEPGMAFGTGTHETTRLCLEMIEKYLTPGDTVLDVGCGSGILSIASLLLKAKSAIGVDINELAVKVSRENAKLNNVHNRFIAVSGSLTQNIYGKFNLVVANIVSDIIIKLSENIHKYMYNNSTYIMSGIIDSRLNDVLSALSGKFDIIEQKSQKGWFCLVAKQNHKYLANRRNKI